MILVSPRKPRGPGARPVASTGRGTGATRLGDLRTGWIHGYLPPVQGGDHTPGSDRGAPGTAAARAWVHPSEVGLRRRVTADRRRSQAAGRRRDGDRGGAAAGQHQLPPQRRGRPSGHPLRSADDRRGRGRGGPRPVADHDHRSRDLCAGRCRRAPRSPPRRHRPPGPLRCRPVRRCPGRRRPGGQPRRGRGPVPLRGGTAARRGGRRGRRADPHLGCRRRRATSHPGAGDRGLRRRPPGGVPRRRRRPGQRRAVHPRRAPGGLGGVRSPVRPRR